MTDGAVPRRRRHSAILGLALVLALAGMALQVFNIGEWVDIQRAWVESHPLPNGRIPWEFAIDDGQRVAIVVFSILYALLASVPALVIVAWLTRRAGRTGSEAILAAALTWPVFGLLASRVQEVILFIVGMRDESWAFAVLVPPTEELLLLACAAAVLLRKQPKGVRPAIALGLATGIGMNIWETGFYVQADIVLSQLGSTGQLGQWSVVGLRAALLGFGLHAVTAALSTLGLAISLGRPVGRGRWVPALAALGGSILVHAAWNATANPIVNRLLAAIATPESIDNPWLAFIAGSIVALPYVAIPGAILIVFWRRAGQEPEPRDAEPGPEPDPDPGDEVSPASPAPA